MSGKAKMRCARCGKNFRQSNAKQVLCLDCEAKERQARAASKAVVTTRPAAAPVQQPKIVGPGAGILVPGLVSAAPDPTSAAALPSQSRSSHEMRATPASYGAAPSSSHAPAVIAAPHAPSSGPNAAGAKAGQPKKHERRATGETAARAPHVPRPAKPARPASAPFELTDELRAKIEARYTELAQPVEFDGIRTQIAAELAVPKAVVKKAVLELRARVHMPSWWELQAYTGTPTDLERIRQAYTPHLPLPDVGVHKQIADALNLPPLVVYHGIRRVRAELRLPQFNAPELHAPPAEAANVADASVSLDDSASGTNDAQPGIAQE